LFQSFSIGSNLLSLVRVGWKRVPLIGKGHGTDLLKVPPKACVRMVFGLSPVRAPRRILGAAAALWLLVGATCHVGSAASFVTTLNLNGGYPVVAWGDNRFGQTDTRVGLSNVIAIAGGEVYSLALKANGTVVRWGYSLPEVPVGLSNIIAIAAGFYHSLALRADGTVVAWGDNSFQQLKAPVGLSNVVAIAAGVFHSLALNADGTVVGWGNDWDAGISADMRNVVAVAAGSYHSLALNADGTVIAWRGKNLLAGPANMSNVIAIAAGYYHNLALKADGTVVGWGESGHTIEVPPGLSDVVAITAGGLHNLALRTDGTVVG